LIQLREYQADLVARAREAFRRHQRLLVQSPTGSGKTIFFAWLANAVAAKGKRVCILVHRRELVRQTCAKLDLFGLPYGVIAAGRRDVSRHIVNVASVQTLVRRLALYEDAFDLIVVDECFPRGTMIDGRPIEEVRCGDYVRTFDASSRKVSRSRVTRLFRRKVLRVVALYLDNGNRVVCTPNHPILTLGGWLRAEQIAEGCLVNIDPMYRVRGDSSVPLEGAVGRVEEVGASVLLGPMPRCLGVEGHFSAHGTHEQEARFGPDDRAKPHAFGRKPREDDRDAASDRASACSARGERQGPELVTAGVTHGARPGVVARAGCPSHGRPTRRLADPLQDRFSSSDQHDRNRGGWRQPRLSESKAGGSEKGELLALARVVRVEVHERGCSSEFERLCPEGDVYNFEVEGTHTYFAEGLAVHNCHHAVAGTWETVLAAYPKARVLGVTATPERLDGRGLGDVFQELIVGPSVKHLIEAGYLADYVAYAPESGPPDLSGIKTIAGDFDQRALAGRMTEAKLVGDAVEHYRDRAAGKPGVAFCVSVAHAELLAEQFCAAGIRAASVDGKLRDDVRDRRFGALESGELDLLTSCELINEGVDIPGIKAVLLCRPTKSLAVYLQQVGRSSRPSGGERAVILDHAGNIERHLLPDADREWSLEARKRKKAPTTVKMCKACYAYVPASARACPECGTAFEAAKSDDGPRIPETKAGKLVEVSRLPKHGRLIAEKLAEAESLEDCRVLAMRFGFKKGWAWHAWNAEVERRKFVGPSPVVFTDARSRGEFHRESLARRLQGALEPDGR
jgi:superfamily II DNA or RNA helicase